MVGQSGVGFIASEFVLRRFVTDSKRGDGRASSLANATGRQLQAWWFNPRTGQATPAGEWRRKSRDAFPRHTFMPPAEGDWALLVEDARQGDPPLSDGH